MVDTDNGIHQESGISFTQVSLKVQYLYVRKSCEYHDRDNLVTIDNFVIINRVLAIMPGIIRVLNKLICTIITHF